MIGELVGPHRIVERLGRGALSEVFRTYNSETSRDVALKILLNPPDQVGRARFAREAEALRALHHPNIIEILQVGEHEDRPWYTMPFVRVLNLQDVVFQRVQVDKGRFSQDEVLRIFVDVARALRYAHAKGFVHRDVKPGNILVDPGFRPILCDFGLARHAGAETLTRHGAMVGTPRYMAPEQLQGKRATPRSDLYALGLVIYEMAAGQVPLGAGEPLAAAVRRLTEDIPPLEAVAPHLAKELTGLVMQMLERDPRQRPEGAAALVEVLEGLPGVPAPLAPEGAETEVDAPALEPERVPSIPGDQAAPAPRPHPSGEGDPSPAVRGGPRAALAAGGALALAAAAAAYLGAPGGMQLDARCQVSPGVDRAAFVVEADAPVRLSIRYGAPGRLDGLASPPGGPATRHQVQLDGLRPDTEYAFSLVFQRDGARHEEPPQRFRTAAEPPKVQP